MRTGGTYTAVVVLLEAGGHTGLGEAPLRGRSEAVAIRAARQTAELDLAARAAGVRLADLLGGGRRNGVRCSALVTSTRPADVAAEVERCVAGGFTAVKLKAMNGGGPVDQERLGAARWAAGREVELRLDFNGRLSTREALTALNGLKAFEPIVFEQPLPAEAAVREWAGLGDPGFMALPPGPGLGVELDRAALERYRADR